MPYSLKGRNVLVTGGSRGLGALVAQKFAAEGSNIAINYHSNKDAADTLAADIASKYNVKTVVVKGDAGITSDCINTVKSATEQLGGLDVVISNAGWTKMTQYGDLDATDDADWDKCWNVNVKSALHLFKTALPTFNANPDGGAFIITASIAGIIPSGSSIPYGVSKAALIHLMKCLASSQGPKIRINAIVPGLLLTEWGKSFPQESIGKWEAKTILKQAPDLDDTAEMFLTLAKSSSMTGQAIRIDSGFGLLQ
ncbi:hypothetical protein N7495_006026 [Penicillium taxi]|uniref:uncharacterized protein n=1 Tax=Penicillium taxi TaxID=168475 RepID=UPI0025451257|nr:uncharacterized protein N7495_006026 [Penicillium taxi]KAJ5894335.1 hypothetical protein N7495_006026 [Penicillium taxi]